jgi:hypothetical protein
MSITNPDLSSTMTTGGTNAFLQGCNPAWANSLPLFVFRSRNYSSRWRLAVHGTQTNASKRLVWAVHSVGGPSRPSSTTPQGLRRLQTHDIQLQSIEVRSHFEMHFLLHSPVLALLVRYISASTGLDIVESRFCV